MFGKRKEQLMSQEPKESNQEKPITPSASRTPKKEVELFPPIAERNLNGPAVPAGGGGRLSTQISMFQPVSFEEALDIVEALRARNATTISLDKLKKNDANRLVDFVAGASAALDGDFHKMTEQVFVFCPANIKILSAAKTQAQTSSTSLTRALANSSSPSSSSSSNYALDALFPDLGQEKYGTGGFGSPFWARQ
ncbi:MAG: cell division protein SepF [Candidatus Obscuribacterales bacterium]|nr:cell division protein SepF [Candidatus Obscuribacterales bacterium]